MTAHSRRATFRNVERPRPRGHTRAHLTAILSKDEADAQALLTAFVDDVPEPRARMRLRMLVKLILPRLGLNHETATCYGALAGQASLAATKGASE
jgi:hypothetical protein